MGISSVCAARVPCGGLDDHVIVADYALAIVAGQAPAHPAGCRMATAAAGPAMP
jgi:hypothetical protein